MHAPREVQHDRVKRPGGNLLHPVDVVIEEPRIEIIVVPGPELPEGIAARYVEPEIGDRQGMVRTRRDSPGIMESRVDREELGGRVSVSELAGGIVPPTVHHSIVAD